MQKLLLDQKRESILQGRVDTTSEAGTAYARFKATSFFPSINGLRAICALVVVKEHVLWRLPLPQLFEWGYLGVDMFFVISGFLIVTLLLRERAAHRRIDLRAFYLRRTLRIFPIYYLVIFLIAFVALATYGHSSKSWELYKWSIPVFLIYGQDLIPISLGWMFHTWSLAMEEQFYLVWPAVEKYLKANWIVPLLVVLIGLNQACNFGLFGDAIQAVYGAGDARNRPVFLITFTPILLGVLAAHGMHHPATGLWLTAALRARGTPLVLLLLMVAVCEMVPQLQGFPRFLIHLLFCALLLSLVVAPRHVLSPLLDSRPLAALGRISYGIYLYHVFVLAAVEKVLESRQWHLAPFAMFLIVGGVSIGLAAVSFRFLERPIMSWGRPRSKAGAVAPGGPAAAIRTSA